MPEEVAPLEMPVDGSTRASRAPGAHPRHAASGRTRRPAPPPNGMASSKVILLPLRVEGRSVGVLALDFYAESAFLAVDGADAGGDRRARKRWPSRTRACTVRPSCARGWRTACASSARRRSPRDERDGLSAGARDRAQADARRRGLVSRVTYDGRLRVVAGAGKDAPLVGMSMPARRAATWRDAVAQPWCVEDMSKLTSRLAVRPRRPASTAPPRSSW